MHLRRRYRAILSYTGMILLLCAGLMLVPAVVGLLWPHELRLALGFVLPAMALAAVGFALWRGFRLQEPTALTTHQGAVIVVLSWLIACIAGALPFMLVEGLDFTHSLFESVSGWTTTGLSVVDVTEAARMTLLWRSLMQLAGGAGLAIIMLASITGPAGIGLPSAEGRSEQLVPHVRASLKVVLTLYAGYMIIGVLGYWIAGMAAFDAVNHSFAAVSTGGFSTHPDSIGAWNEIRVEAVTIPLMLLGSLNYLTAWALVRRRFQVAFRNGELKLIALLIPIAAILLHAVVAAPLYRGNQGVRVAIFETVSALSTTGFATVSYVEWGGFGVMLLILLMIVGGGAGSTSGGMKQYRIYVLAKSLIWQIQEALLPPTAVVERFIWHGEHKDFIDDQRVRVIGNYLFLYLATVLIATLVISSCGFSIGDALFEAASMTGTVGLSVGVIGYGVTPTVLWTAIVTMLLGRLEFFVIFTGLLKLGIDGRKMFLSRRRSE